MMMVVVMMMMTAEQQPQTRHSHGSNRRLVRATVSSIGTLYNTRCMGPAMGRTVTVHP